MPGFLDDIETLVPALRRYARALTGNADRADDLVQDCLERAISKQSLWRPIGPVRPWLFKIMINLHRNDHRKRRGSPEPEALELLSVEPASPATQGARLALAETAAALDRLPVEQREALLLVALEGLSYAEAAGALDIPVGTLMSRIGRAREALRTMVDGPGPRLRSVK
ncbi:sigma-70 family RNA polymerase sigma factor [Pleomorphomonas sp. JP5]|uniref:sigma-70 family RNA polymerase sigma factor n=1 Tax=Pleomorphomonas sp. JP5 TaxID=2942998 RepID=UPI002043009E|nr:sigma-70 family RNA polymerase sigma factor [Pleomorphomonas sp. JP5]MCM5558531.1 sigma-70 family RNA polymerase sigma factor [Pleomorphomonas sp. JP5]